MMKGAIWSTIERFSVQAIQFVVNIIIARILTPAEYGIIGLLTVFIAFLTVFIDGGFTKALIQKQNRTEVDLSTIFFFNTFVSFFCYGVLWYLAPNIADFYNIPSLVILTRTIAVAMVLNAFYAIPLTILTIKIDFKTITVVNLMSTLLGGIIGVLLAFRGYGVWALVMQTLSRSLTTVVIMWIYLKWKPQLVFSIPSLRAMFGFGSNYVLSSILSMAVNNISTLFIAKLSSSKDVGFYTRGTQFADIVFSSFTSVIDSVLLPSLSTIQNEKEILVNMTRSVIKSTAMITTPILVGFAVVARPLINVLLTDKWLPAVPIMQIICVARLITIVASINVNVLYVLGRTDLALKQNYLKIIIRIVFLLLAFKFGIVYIALAELCSTIIHFFINCYFPGKILKYGAGEQIKDLMPILFVSSIMALCMLGVMNLINNEWLKLIITPVVGMALYICALYLLKVDEFFTIFNKLKRIYRKQI